MENQRKEQSNEFIVDDLDDVHQFNQCDKMVNYFKYIKRIKELEDRHQLDCIKINQLNTTIDILVDKLAQLRRYVE